MAQQDALIQLNALHEPTSDRIPDRIFHVLSQLLPQLTCDEIPTLTCSGQCVCVRWSTFYFTMAMLQGQEFYFVVDHPRVKGGEGEVGRILDAWRMRHG